jgi:NAD+-dependent protein deacetylase SIR2
LNEEETTGNQMSEEQRLTTNYQNSLERKAGVPPSKIVEAHGSFATSRCITCKTPFDNDEFKKIVDRQEIPHCQVPQCNGLVKPDIVFFGEALPSTFFSELDAISDTDLCIIMGTSLSVQPFSRLPFSVPEASPRVLINLEEVGDLGSRRDDVLLLGDCDTGCKRFAKEMGLLEELENIWFGMVSEERKQKYLAEKEKERKELEQKAKIMGDEEIDLSVEEEIGHVKSREEVDEDVRDEVEKMVADVEEALAKTEELKKKVDEEGLAKSETDKQLDALTEDVKKVEIKDDDDMEVEKKKVQAAIGNIPSL